MQDRVDQRLVRHPLLRRARLQFHQVALRDRDRNPPPLAVERPPRGVFPERPLLLDAADRNPFAALRAFDQVALFGLRQIPLVDLAYISVLLFSPRGSLDNYIDLIS